jgi:hypothetical protein
VAKIAAAMIKARYVMLRDSIVKHSRRLERQPHQAHETIFSARSYVEEVRALTLMKMDHVLGRFGLLLIGLIGAAYRVLDVVSRSGSERKPDGGDQRNVIGVAGARSRGKYTSQ